MKRLFIAAILAFTGISSVSAQIREIPKAVETTFTGQYPDASEVKYTDHIVRVDVSFKQEGENMLASYTNKGAWKETFQDYNFERLPDAVKTGFSKSKYADREITEVILVHLPGGSQQYRLRTRKNEVEKKYLYFNPDGRLLRESLTL